MKHTDERFWERKISSWVPYGIVFFSFFKALFMFVQQRDHTVVAYLHLIHNLLADLK